MIPKTHKRGNTGTFLSNLAQQQHMCKEPVGAGITSATQKYSQRWRTAAIGLKGACASFWVDMQIFIFQRRNAMLLKRCWGLQGRRCGEKVKSSFFFKTGYNICACAANTDDLNVYLSVVKVNPLFCWLNIIKE